MGGGAGRDGMGQSEYWNMRRVELGDGKRNIDMAVSPLFPWVGIHPGLLQLFAGQATCRPTLFEPCLGWLGCSRAVPPLLRS